MAGEADGPGIGPARRAGRESAMAFRNITWV